MQSSCPLAIRWCADCYARSHHWHSSCQLHRRFLQRPRRHRRWSLRPWWHSNSMLRLWGACVLAADQFGAMPKIMKALNRDKRNFPYVLHSRMYECAYIVYTYIHIHVCINENLYDQQKESTITIASTYRRLLTIQLHLHLQLLQLRCWWTATPYAGELWEQLRNGIDRFTARWRQCWQAARWAKVHIGATRTGSAQGASRYATHTTAMTDSRGLVVLSKG